MDSRDIDTLTVENASKAFNTIARQLPVYPGGHAGRGIVIPAGGIRYFTCAWVCINILRRLGCTLPIEVWHLGPEEMTDPMRQLLEPLAVRTVDAAEVRKLHPVRLLEGWPLKCYAIMRSSFAEVLLLDADNVPVVDPSFLFDCPQYNETGTIFWPDYMSHPAQDPIWNLVDLAYRDEPELESGQLVVDKRRCWAPLRLAMWMNEYADFWYEHFLGDKESFHFAWRKLEVPYAIPQHPIHSLHGVMCQHDFDGRRIFQHRNMTKWCLGVNPRIDGFWLENECFEFLARLDQQWEPLKGFVESLSAQDRGTMQKLSELTFRYVRVGFDERIMRFRADGLVIEGMGGREAVWWVEGEELILADDRFKVTCRLKQGVSGAWEGKWLMHEQMPIRLEVVM